LFSGTAAVAQRDYPNYQNQNSDQHQNNGERFNSERGNDSRNDRPRWSRGDRLPEQYRQDRYAVTDWQQHYLRTPQRGYRWVRNDNDQYVLAGITSGIIVEIVSQNQYRNDYRWSRGDRLSGGYLESRYVVSDWRGNHLRRPARGYHWVHVNDQYMLVSVGNGLIAEIVVNGR